MGSDKRFKRFQRASARYALYACGWLFGHLPYKAVRALANALISIAFCFLIRQRKIAEESIEIAFGNEKTPEERQGIIKGCFESFGRGMVEMMYFLVRPDMAVGKVVFEGKEYLDAAMARGKGVIAVTAHFGNFPLMMLICAQAGYPTSSIIRPARDEALTEYFYKKRERVGVGTVFALPRRECVMNSLKFLRNKGLLFIPIDQNFGGEGGVYVEFFGQKAATATGPAVLAMRTGAAIVPMFIVRQDDGDTHKIIIEPPVRIVEGDDENVSMTATMANITRVIEQYIRRYPKEWAWMHRRWKSRPSGRGEDSASAGSRETINTREGAG